MLLPLKKLPRVGPTTQAERVESHEAFLVGKILLQLQFPIVSHMKEKVRREIALGEKDFSQFPWFEGFGWVTLA